MKVSRKLSVITATLTLLTFLAVSHATVLQELKSLITSARGEGTLKVGGEVFKVSSVVANLKEDGTGEITLVTDLQLVLQCTWTAPADLSKGVDLKITGGTSVGGAQGSGKLFLRSDNKSIASLSLDAMSNVVKRKIEIKFVAVD